MEYQDIKFSELTGVTGFLNGQEGLHEDEEELSEYLKGIGKEVLIIDNLFENPKKIAQITKCDNLAFSTTGVFHEELGSLKEAFKKLKYAPKTVIFFSERTAMIFCGIARDLKKKHKTKFYYPTFFENELQEIGWI